MAELVATIQEDADDTQMVELISGDGESYKVRVDVAKISVFIGTMISDDADDEKNSIPLPNVRSGILSKVIEYLIHYKEEPMKAISKVAFYSFIIILFAPYIWLPFLFCSFKPLKSATIADVVQEWYATYMGTDMEQDYLFELILAANYLDIQPLLDLTCATMATRIRGKTPEEIRQIFNIANDFTPEDDAALHDENNWCED